jgi:molecular chaperone GrpE
MGVSAFGERGDRFDPTLHEAASHEGHGTDLVIDTVLRRGYTFGVHKVLRTALVTVIDRDRYENTSTAGDPPEDPPGTNTSPDPSSDTDARLESGGAGDPGADPNPYRCG